MPELKAIEVAGRPIPYSSEVAEETWCEIVYRKTAPHRPDPEDVPEDSVFEVSLTFSLSANRLHAMDVDNLVKTVLDTIFTCRDRRKLPSGALFDADDARVDRLVAEKRAIREDEAEGVTIRVRWWTPRPRCTHWRRFIPAP